MCRKIYASVAKIDVGIASRSFGYDEIVVSVLISFFLTLRLLMSYIYMEYLFLMFLDHTQRRSTVGRTPLDE